MGVRNVGSSVAFEGFSIDKTVQPRIKIQLSKIGFTKKIFRSTSNLASFIPMLGKLTSEANPTIKLKNLFDNIAKSQKIQILLTGTKSKSELDRTVMGSYA